MSLHLPHKGLDLNEFTACLLEIDMFLESLGPRMILLGVDANTRMGSVVDYVHVGEHVDRAFDAQDRDRAPLLHDFLCRHGLFLANTFDDEQHQLHTRYNWSRFGGAQIDFLAISFSVACLDAGVDESMEFSSDHRMIWARTRQHLAVARRSNRLAPRNWIPSESWLSVAAGLSWDWYNWTQTTQSWWELATKHTNRPPKVRDEVLDNLLERHACSSPAEKRSLNKLIWRHRRAKKRWRAKQTLQLAVEKGSLPKTAPKRISVNWAKLSTGTDPAILMHNYFTDLYSASEVLQFEEDNKQYFIDSWISLRTELSGFTVTPNRLRAALRKLKNSKGSPDGCVAEMYKNLPDEAFNGLAAYLTCVLATFCIPEDWTAVCSTLIPKIVAASSLDKFRAIACLPAARKLLGYLWLQMLPTMRYESLQCGFVPKSHAANGVYLLKRAAELSREWKLPFYLVQLDLKKAFDKVLHTAVTKALRLQGASLQCVAVICAILRQSKASVSLGHVQAAAVHMQRGLPQGAPESPLIFTLVTELVLRPLIQRWKADGLGWRMGDFSILSVCYADDVILCSHSKKDLEKMLRDVVAAFLDVGLEISAPKCHWTSFPACRGAILNFEQTQLEWEDSLTFVGTVLDVTGNDGRAIAYRLAQATKVYHKWRPVLHCANASIKCRVALCCNTFLSALLWLSETWYPTKKQRSSLSSWAARCVGRVVGVKRNNEESWVDFWRRLHRTGHAVLKQLGSADTQRRKKLHSFAGHLARMPEEPAGHVLRLRNLAWWRDCQSRGILAHKCRFKAWRWEHQLEDFYGQSKSLFMDENVGWLAYAQCRSTWRDAQKAFSEHTGRLSFAVNEGVIRVQALRADPCIT